MAATSCSCISVSVVKHVPSPPARAASMDDHPAGRTHASVVTVRKVRRVVDAAHHARHEEHRRLLEVVGEVLRRRQDARLAAARGSSSRNGEATDSR